MSNNNGFKHVQGFEFTEDMSFNDDAVFILGTLRRQNCVYVQTDDSGAEAINQLRLAANETGYFHVASSPNCHHHWIIISEHFEVTLMDPFED